MEPKLTNNQTGLITWITTYIIISFSPYHFPYLVINEQIVRHSPWINQIQLHSLKADQNYKEAVHPWVKHS